MIEDCRVGFDGQINRAGSLWSVGDGCVENVSS